MGSKNRIAKYLLPIILKDRKEGQYYVEPFVGGANMIDKVEGNRIGADNNEYLIELLREMTKENFKAPKINETLYYEIKNNKDNFQKYIVGYAGTQLSFGATWFGSYRRDKQGARDYCKEARNNVEKQSKNLKGIEFIYSSYNKLEIPSNSIIYCDPPYHTEATKGKYKEDFNHSEFWKWCREKSKEGHQVFISEYNAPEDFECIWEGKIAQRMNNSKKEALISTEKLFIYKGDK